MIAVCIIGVLASVAIPTYGRFVMRSRAAEVPSNLAQIYKGMHAYWEGQHNTRYIGGTAATHCWIDDGGNMGDSVPPMPPGPEPRTADWMSYPSYAAVGFAPAGPVYAIYAWGHPPANEGSPAATMRCGITEADLAVPVISVIIGATDLDGDGLLGGYTMQVGLRGEQIYREPGFGTAQSGMAALGMGACPFCSADFID